MNEHGDDLDMATRVGRLTGGKQVTARHLRFAGGYCIFACGAFAGLNTYAWQSRTLYPPTIVIGPAVLLIGLWLLLDAEALAARSRRRQRGILWAGLGIGCALGSAVMHALTGSFF
jgi:hypothetical protein